MLNWMRSVALLADTKIPEDHIQKILDTHPARQPPERPGRQPQFLGNELLPSGRLRDRARKRPRHLFERIAMSPSCYQRRLASGKRLGGKRGERGDQWLNPLPG
jgi:hypothetical protein